MAAHHASKVDSAFEHKSVKGLEDSNWDKFKDWWDQVYKVLSIICDIAAILAIFLSWVPILGQVLAVLAAIGKIMLVLNALIQIVDSVGKAVDGKKGVLECLGDVVTNLVGALAGKVLGASGKIVSGLSKGKNFGQLMVKQFSAPLSPSVKNLAHFTKMNKSLKNASGFGKVPVVFKNMGQSFKLNSDLRFRHGSTGSGAGDGAMRFVFGSGAEYVSTMLKNGTMNRLGAIYSVASAGHASYQFINHTYNFGLAVHNGDAGGAFAHGSNAVGGSLPGSWGTVAGIPGKVHEHMS